MNYPTLPGLTSDGRIFRNEEAGTVESMVSSGSFAICRPPAMLELPGGDMLCCWFASTYEEDADVYIACARLPKGADRWTEPVAVPGDPRRSERNPFLFYGPDGAAWCMYTAQLDCVAGKDNMQLTSRIRCQKSFDGGPIWSDYEIVFPREGSFYRQPIRVLKNGRRVFGNWLCTDPREGLSSDPSVFQFSDDQGKTRHMVKMPNSCGRVHPTVVELDNGHLVTFMRSREADNVYRNESLDWGETWSEPKSTPLLNNNSFISTIHTKSGRATVAYDPACTPSPVSGKAMWPGLRCPVAVTLSEDGGLTFPLIRWMEHGEGYIGEENKTNNKQYEYPYLMQSTDGRLHLTYAAYTCKCIKYVSFTEEDVIDTKRECVGAYNPTSGEETK